MADRFFRYAIAVDRNDALSVGMGLVIELFGGQDIAYRMPWRAKKGAPALAL